jgi:hypothetical protein
MAKKNLSEFDICPDDEILKAYSLGNLTDDQDVIIVESHVEFCASCRDAVSEYQSSESLRDRYIESIVERIKDWQAEVKRNEDAGPMPGTIWRAVPETEDSLFGPLLLVLANGPESGDPIVVEMSEDLFEKVQGGVILKFEEWGCPSVYMVHASKTFSVSPGQLKEFAGRVNDSLTRDIGEYCNKHGSMRKEALHNYSRNGKEVMASNEPRCDSPAVGGGSRGEKCLGESCISQEVFVPLSKASSVTQRGSIQEQVPNHSSVDEQSVIGLTYDSSSRRARLHTTSLIKSHRRLAAVLVIVIIALEGYYAVIPGLRSWFESRPTLLSSDLAFGALLFNSFLMRPPSVSAPFLLLAIFYALPGILLLSIAKKSRTNGAWLAFIPGGNLLLMTRIAQISYWWLLVLAIPALWLFWSHRVVSGIDMFGISVLSCPWGWPGLLLLMPIFEPLGMGEALLLSLFVIGWFLVARGFAAQRGKGFIWALLMFFPITTPIAFLYLALSGSRLKE